MFIFRDIMSKLLDISEQSRAIINSSEVAIPKDSERDTFCKRSWDLVGVLYFEST